jgi:ribosomal protein S27AE
MRIKPGRGERELDPEGFFRHDCPRCGAAAVLHLLPGAPDTDERGVGDPSWVQRTGERSVDRNRWCAACGDSWTQVEMPRRFPFALRGSGGRVLTIVPVPTLSLSAGIRVDIELVRPGRFVRLLDRRLEPDTLRRLHELLTHAAVVKHPQWTLPRVVDVSAGLEIRATGATDSTVDLAVCVTGDVGEGTAQRDRITLRMSHLGLESAADDFGWWLP